MLFYFLWKDLFFFYIKINPFNIFKPTDQEKEASSRSENTLQLIYPNISRNIYKLPYQETFLRQNIYFKFMEMITEYFKLLCCYMIFNWRQAYFNSYCHKNQISDLSSNPG